MTADEAHWRYVKARQDYDDAIYNKNQCQNGVYDCESERRQKIQEFNELQSQLNKFLQAHENMSKTNIRDQLESGLGRMGTEMGDASDFFRTIATSSEGEIDLASHIMNDDEKKKSHSAVDRIFTKIKKARTNVEDKIEDLRRKISLLEQSIDDLDMKIRRYQDDIDYWERVKQKNMNDMEMYRALEKKLLAAC